VNISLQVDVLPTICEAFGLTVPPQVIKTPFRHRSSANFSFLSPCSFF
jgi:hypothetical protein